MFIGSTDDGHTFIVLNDRLPGAYRMLTEAGFAPRRHAGRTVYLLPPCPAEDASRQTGDAMHGLFTRTYDIADLSWTTHWHPTIPVPAVPAARIRFNGSRVAATTSDDTARDLLIQQGFTTDTSEAALRLPEGLSEPEKLDAVLFAYNHLAAHGTETHVHLGIATPDDIPPRRRPTNGVTPPTPPAKGRTR